MTRYVLADVQQAGDELARRAAELTEWLDRVAAQYRPPPEPGPAETAVALADLACVRTVSAAALRLAEAARALSACQDDLRDVDHEIGRRLCRWTG